ncbi:MAG: glutamate-5-semialdehyde dehydrogenase [Alphaproteobacteria bacterium]|nr:glutamate-5-semialdehyde dehydrogenase [Alphaproteobacteria bacterium]
MVNSSLYHDIEILGQQAKAASIIIGQTSAEIKTQAILESIKFLIKNKEIILKANNLDLDLAQEKKVSSAFLDRLKLDEKRIESIAKGLNDIAALKDPVGKTLAQWQRPNGLKIQKISVPFGVIGIIYEARPNVTADAGALCLKSGNAVILRSGSESFHSSQAIHQCLLEGLKTVDLPIHAIQLIQTTDRDAVGHLLSLSKYVDIIIPRGGRSLIERIKQESQIPVIAHLDGLCHTYVNSEADPKKALAIVINAKMRRPGICGATETLLIDKQAHNMLAPILQELFKINCEIRGDALTCALDSRVKPATEKDWDTEYLDAILSVKQVDNIDEAIAHINKHGSKHTEAIITENQALADKFFKEIDAGILMHNTSTQFADGGEFGMGAEIGISTGKLHARGPVGIEQLTTYKYIVHGQGQIRS